MISVVLCTYNREKLIKETIDSILGQTYQDFELILVDDGSTDRTKEILKSYSDSRIRLFLLEKNQYYCAAANFGITKMRGDYLAIADSDDVWHPDKLEIQMQYLEKHKDCGACFTYADTIDENGNDAAEDFPEISRLLKQDFATQEGAMRYFLRDGNCLAHPSAVIPNWMINKIGGFNLLYCQAADLDMWVRIIRLAPIFVIPKVLVRYRCHHNPKNQISGGDELKTARFMNEHMLIRKQMINDLTDEELIRFFEIDFKKKGASTHLELEIERAFLLLNCVKGLPSLRVLGIEKFEEILARYQLEAVEKLEMDYKIRLQDIYQWNMEHFYVDFGIHVNANKQIQIQQKLELEHLKLGEKLRAVQEDKKSLELEEKMLKQKVAEHEKKVKAIQDELLILEKSERKLTDKNKLLVQQNKSLEAECQQAKQKVIVSLTEEKKAERKLQKQLQENEQLLVQLEQQVLHNVELKEKRKK